MKTKRVGSVIAALIIGSAVGAQAVLYTPVTWTERLIQGDPGLNAGLLDASVWMGVDGGSLYVMVQNTSPDAAFVSPPGIGAAVAELTGIAFNMPGGVIVVGGNAAPDLAGGSVLSGGNLATMNDQWGWNQATILTGGAYAYAFDTYNVGISTMTSQAPNSFGGGNVDGLNYGAVSDLESTVPGHPHVVDTLILRLDLVGSVPWSTLIDSIDAAPIAVMFGSPNIRYTTPDGGSTIMLLGGALSAIAMIARRKK